LFKNKGQLSQLAQLAAQSCDLRGIEQINQTLTHIKFFRQEVVFSHSATASDFSDD